MPESSYPFKRCLEQHPYLILKITILKVQTTILEVYLPIGTYYHFYSQIFLWRPFVLTKYRWTTYFVNLKVFSYNRLDV